MAQMMQLVSLARFPRCSLLPVPMYIYITFRTYKYSLVSKKNTINNKKRLILSLLGHALLSPPPVPLHIIYYV